MNAYTYRVSFGEGERGSRGPVLEATPLGTPGLAGHTYQPGIQPDDNAGRAAARQIGDLIRALGGTQAHVQNDLVSGLDNRGPIRHHAGVALADDPLSVGDNHPRLFLAPFTTFGDVGNASIGNLNKVTFMLDLRWTWAPWTPWATRLAATWLYIAVVRALSRGCDADQRRFRYLVTPEPQELALWLLESPGHASKADIADRITSAQEEVRVHNEYVDRLLRSMLGGESVWRFPDDMSQGLSGSLSIDDYVVPTLRDGRTPAMRSLVQCQDTPGTAWSDMLRHRPPGDGEYDKFANMAVQVRLAEAAKEGLVIVIGDSVYTEPLMNDTQEFMDSRIVPITHLPAQLVGVDPLRTFKVDPLFKSGAIRIPPETRSALPGSPERDEMGLSEILNQVFAPGHVLT